MIRDNQRYLNMLHILIDAALVAASYLLAYYIRFHTGLSAADAMVTGGVLPMSVYFSALYYLVPAYLLLYFFFALYTPRRATTFLHEFSAILKANLVGLLGFFVALYVARQPNFSRAMIFIFAGVNVVLSTVVRWMLRKILRRTRRNGRNLRHALMVGYSRSTENYIARVKENPEWGYVINGILDDRIPVGTKYREVHVVGKTDELQQQLQDNQYDEIIIALPLDQYDRLEELIDLCEKSGVHSKFIPDYSGLFPSNPYTEVVLGLPVISIRYVPLTGFFPRLVKRLTDIIGSLVAIVIFSPFMLLAAVGVRLSGKGPVIFRQERVGLNGVHFMMYKFRTMHMQQDEEEKEAWTTKNDPRVTGFGRFLRATSLDETPQFFNVLFGHMSLVGPRPERPQFVEKFREEIPRYMIKHQVRPGITGWAQVNGYRGDTSIRKRIEYDLYYIENWTYSFDLRILFSTIFHVFRQKNAY